MTKGSDLDFVGLYAAIIKDVAAHFPLDQKEWDRDLSRLISLYQTRGPSVFTMDLPALGKRLDRALSSGRLDVAGMAHSGSRHPHSMVPRLFWGLWSRLFDDSGCLKTDVDANVVLFLRTLLYVGKNFKAECAPRYLFEAIHEFFDVEAELPPPSQIWDGDGSDVGDTHHLHLRDMVSTPDSEPLLFNTDMVLPALLDSVQRIADRISREFVNFCPQDLDFRHGPGAVSDASRGSYKYDFPTWSPRLEYLFPYDECGTTSLGISEVDATVGFDLPFREERSVLIAVPKTMKGPRLIAKEPTCHQWIQQGIRDFVYRRVSKTWIGNFIDFFDQEPSREMALLHSLEGGCATIDLKSASDRITCRLVERIFRNSPNFLAAMIASRTRFLENPLDKRHESLIKLRKFSTQGSALTFPIQSIVFLAVCLGVGMHLEGHRSIRRMIGRVRIFGDDLIVPVEWEPLVGACLHALHLRVNLTKTHATGNFRESCGMDAFRGYDVTPPYVLSAPVESDPTAVASWLAVTNNLFKKGFWHACQWLESTLPQSILDRIPVVKPSSGLFARVSFCGALPPRSSKRRWNESLQYEEFSFLGIFVKNRVARTDTASNLLQFFTEEPPSYIKYESGVVVAGTPVKRSAWAGMHELLE